ncbi:HEPN domain-containing protein [Bacillus idriensis]|uniref:HEPN domain-containing protein n=1 Tax=Metabacillus idriensis TaxID=324768 RepID=A0A6I2M9H9_9BACI|nr:HEPN domain-containing protein [Metabacillus idriensis]MRX54860.1 HEPN domain-containing protein [Metabacillus idriensis]
MFDWNSYLNLANSLSNNSDEESKRSAISRAYYSSFHNARSYLDKKGINYKSQKNVHFAVWNTFSMLSGDARKISAKGDRLKYKRQQADYDNEISSVNNLTKDALLDAKFINDTISKLK